MDKNKETKSHRETWFFTFMLAAFLHSPSSLFALLSSSLLSCDVFSMHSEFFYSFVSCSFVSKYFNSFFAFRRLYALSGTSTFGGFCARGIRFVNFLIDFLFEVFFTKIISMQIVLQLHPN